MAGVSATGADSLAVAAREPVLLELAPGFIGRTGLPSEGFAPLSGIEAVCDGPKEPDKSRGATAIAAANFLGRLAGGVRASVVVGAGRTT